MLVRFTGGSNRIGTHLRPIYIVSNIGRMARSRVKKLKDLLTHSFGEDFEIIEENYKMLTPAGEHYGSIMLALDVAIKRPNEKAEVLNLVAKLIPASEMLRKVFNTGVTFKKELNAYVNTIPALIELQQEYNVPEDKILDMFPACFGARLSLNQNQNDVDENAAIIFENLKVQGYIMEDRLVGFDFEHAKLIVKDLANLHSTAIALRKLKPTVFQEKVSPALVNNDCLSVLPSSFRECIFQHSSTIEELHPYISRIRDFVEASLENFKKPPKKPTDAFATMIHSDYWVNNTMILRDKNGNPIKNKMVDLQLLSYGSALKDLIFFLFSSVINSVLEVYYDEFIKLYYTEFIENIAHLDLDLEDYTWKAFLDEIEEIAPYEAYHILVMVKPIFTERNKITHSLEDFEDNDWSREDLLGEAYRSKLKDTVLALSSRNWL